MFFKVLEAQRIHRAQKSGRFPFLSKPYTYDKVMYAVSGLEIILNRHMNELKKQIILLLSWIYSVFYALQILIVTVVKIMLCVILF